MYGLISINEIGVKLSHNVYPWLYLTRLSKTKIIRSGAVRNAMK